MVRLWSHYKRGFLLNGGGISDQPNRYLEAMELLDAEVGKRQRRDAERERWYAEQGHQDRGKAKPVVHGMPRGKRQRVI